MALNGLRMLEISFPRSSILKFLKGDSSQIPLQGTAFCGPHLEPSYQNPVSVPVIVIIITIIICIIIFTLVNSILLLPCPLLLALRLGNFS